MFCLLHADSGASIYSHPVVAEEHPATDNSSFVPSEDKKSMGKYISKKKMWPLVFSLDKVSAKYQPWLYQTTLVKQF